MGRLEEDGPSSNKRRRRSDVSGATGRHKKHLYLALDDWKDGYSIHKLDADDMEPSGRLPEPAAQRLTAAFFGPMAFAALGNNIFIDTSTLRSRSHAPPTLVYNTETASLAVDPRLPDQLPDLDAAMAVGEKLYAVTTVYVVLNQSPSLQVMSWSPSIKLEPWDPNMDWSWSSLPTSSPPFNGSEIRAYALHPDGHTIFMSTSEDTHSLDTSNGVWRNLGDWVLPFRGQAYFIAGLDAWVGFRREEDGYICCCPVASRSNATTRWPECRILRHKLFHGKEEVGPDHSHLKPSLTYMGHGRFCLVENIMKGQSFHNGAVLHVTLFSLKYDHKGDLQVNGRPTTRSYTVSKNTSLFSHAMFWM